MGIHSRLELALYLPYRIIQFYTSGGDTQPVKLTRSDVQSEDWFDSNNSLETIQPDDLTRSSIG